MLHVRGSERFEYFHHGGFVFIETLLIYLSISCYLVQYFEATQYSTRARVDTVLNHPPLPCLP